MTLSLSKQHTDGLLTRLSKSETPLSCKAVRKLAEYVQANGMVW